jgi:signal transduction histidine kinase
MRWTIRAQLLVPLLALLGAMAGLGGWSAVTAAERTGRRQLAHHLRSLAHNLATANYPLRAHVLAQIKDLSGADLVVVGGEHPGATLPVGVRDWPPPLGPAEADQLEPGPALDVNGQSYFCNGVGLRPDGPNAGAVVYILYPEQRWLAERWAGLGPSLAWQAAGGLAAAAVVGLVTHRFARRLQAVQEQTGHIAAGDFRPLALTGLGDELDALAQSVNDMAAKLAQLQDAMARTERFRLLGQVSGGLAHQLRNGLTGARLALQVQAREQAGAANREGLDVALRQLTLMEKQVQRFLNLGKADAPRQVACSLRSLVNEAVELVQPRCRHALITLTWEPPAEPLDLAGDPDQLGHLLLNLLGNALDAAGPGGEVAVSAGRDKQRLWVAITDNGPGPPADVAGKLFEPFVTAKPEGIGLGLAVARQVAEAHGGEVNWHRRDGRTVFHVELGPKV